MTSQLNLQVRVLMVAIIALMATAQPARSAPCQGGADNDLPLILILGPNEINFIERRPVCIDLRGARERTFKVLVRGSSSDLPVEIREKTSGDEHPTIRGSSSGDSREFTVTVREAENLKKNVSQDYGFLVTVPNHATLDPMVRIIRQGGVTRELQYNDLLQALEEWDIDPADVPGLLSEYDDSRSE